MKEKALGLHCYSDFPVPDFEPILNKMTGLWLPAGYFAHGMSGMSLQFNTLE